MTAVDAASAPSPRDSGRARAGGQPTGDLISRPLWRCPVRRPGTAPVADDFLKSNSNGSVLEVPPPEVAVAHRPRRSRPVELGLTTGRARAPGEPDARRTTAPDGSSANLSPFGPNCGAIRSIALVSATRLVCAVEDADRHPQSDPRHRIGRMRPSWRHTHGHRSCRRHRRLATQTRLFRGRRS